ncbi:MAG: DotI/IcmL/TraM family protein [Candidatus Comchoanobacterales bacterium]
MTDEHNQVKGAELVIERRQFYSDGFHRMVMMSGFLLVTNIIAVFFMIYIITHPPEPRYFQVNDDNQIIADPPLSEPRFTTSEIQTWARTAALSFFTFDYVNYRGQFDNMSLQFTQAGWQAFTEALGDSNLLNEVKQNQYILTARSDQPVNVVGQVNPNTGRYQWQAELNLTYLMAKPNQRSIARSVQVNLFLERVPRSQSPYGLAIYQVNIQ